jgi:hypothetical protein
MHGSVVFPIAVTFENGATERYADVRDLECNLEHFDSDSSPGCLVVDGEGKRVTLKLELLQLKELRLAAS